MGMFEKVTSVILDWHLPSTLKNEFDKKKIRTTAFLLASIKEEQEKKPTYCVHTQKVFF